MVAIAVSVIIWTVLASARGSTQVILLSLPSTVLHELAHWFVALLTGSRPGFPSILPKKVGPREWRLGSVEFAPRPLTAAWVALAPAYLLLAAAWGLGVRPPGEDLEKEVALGVLFGYMAWGGFPSSQDWVIALRYPLGLVTAFATLLLIGAWVGSHF